MRSPRFNELSASGPRTAVARRRWFRLGGAASALGLLLLAAPAYAQADVVTATISVGANPQGLTVTPDGSRVFVANSDGGSVSMIDTATGAVIAETDIAGAPVDVASSPDGSRVYAVAKNSSMVWVLDARTGGIVRSVTVDGLTSSGLTGVAVSADGGTLHVSSDEARVALVRLQGDSWAHIGVCSTRGPQSSIAAGPGYGYVTFRDAGVVESIWNCFTGRVTFPVGAQPEGLAVTPDGARVYVANSGDDSVSVIDVASGRVLAPISVGARPVGVAVTSDGSAAYVVNSGDDSVSVIDTASGVVVEVVGVGASPSRVAVAPDGGHVYVTNSGANTVSVIDTSLTPADPLDPLGPFGSLGSVGLLLRGAVPA